MAKFDEIKKANDEQKRLNKSLDAAVLRVETMEKNYAKFADKRNWFTKFTGPLTPSSFHFLR